MEHAPAFRSIVGKLGGPHVEARSQANPSYPMRFPVTDEQVSWGTPLAGYAPTPYTFKRDAAKVSFADPEDPKSIADLSSRMTYEVFDLDPATGAPVNPAGRTGMCERGRLARWGPNHAADPIVTRRTCRATQPLTALGTPHHT